MSNVFVYATAWLAAAAYALALAWPRAFRVAWITGAASFLTHVLAAFHIKHDWSHKSAYAETAKVTGDVFGTYWGGGVYFNYVFTAVWIADALWLWLYPAAYQRRARWISVAVHAFLAFMFFNATVVFVGGPRRWLAAAATVALLYVWLRRYRQSVP